MEGRIQKLAALAVSTAGTEEGDAAANKLYEVVTSEGIELLSMPKGIWGLKMHHNVVAVESGVGVHVDNLSKAINNLHVGKFAVFGCNGVHVASKIGSSPDATSKPFHALVSERHTKWMDNPQREAEREAAEVAGSKLDSLLANAPKEPTWGDKAGWDAAVNANQDPYGRQIAKYASDWARMMEARVSATGCSVADCADELSHVADNDGISGSMHGVAVLVLSQLWSLGPELRAWKDGGVVKREVPLLA